MPYVTIHYGPYKCYGIIDHRIQKINGLFRALDQLRYDIEVIPVNDFNRLSVEIFEREVFRCDIRNLMFNMPADDDPVCQRALRAVEEANYRMSVEENVPGYTPMARGIRELTPNAAQANIKDNLPSQTDLLFEIHQENLNRSFSRHVHDHIRTEGKMSKVKIMEDKNTTFGSEPSELNDDDETTAGNNEDEID